jgi:murein DD-endopeptidase MepM/ murein hydrolase activator NlpD
VNTLSTDVPAPVPAAVPPSSAPDPASSAAGAESTGISWPIAGGEWKVVQGYNTGTHTNRSGFAQYKYSLDWARVDGETAGQPVFAPVSGTVKWVDRGSGGMLVDAGNGYGVAVFHVTLDRGLASGATVQRGQRIGTISGPGGDGYMSMAHIDITVWSLSGRGHEAVPFTGPNAIAGHEFPDTGGANQHMGTTVTP